MDWATCFGQFLTQPLAAVTAPRYYLQNQGEISVDGLGWVWQCNVFGHFVLVRPSPPILLPSYKLVLFGFQFRAIQPLLLASNASHGTRVIWMSSLEASPKFYESEDWQLKKTEHSYESTKYQIDLIATHLDSLSLQLPESEPVIRHFIAQPGVCSTNFSNALLNPFTAIFSVMIFYLVCPDQLPFYF
jgi:3-keto steroid reductase